MIIKEIFSRIAPNKADGSLCVAEALSETVPFEIKRVYYTYGAETQTVRGHHAHKELEQILVCIYGKIEVELDDGRGTVDKTVLDSPLKGLYIGPSMWRTMKWLESNSVLLVLASQHYNESDYIRDYKTFCEWVHKKGLAEHEQ